MYVTIYKTWYTFVGMILEGVNSSSMSLEPPSPHYLTPTYFYIMYIKYK